MKPYVLASGDRIILRDRLPSDVGSYIRWMVQGKWRLRRRLAESETAEIERGVLCGSEPVKSNRFLVRLILAATAVSLMLVTVPVLQVQGQGPERPRIIVGGDYDYPPYEFLDENGVPTGYNVELTRAIAEVMGLDVEIRLGPWGEIRQALESGEIDAIHGMFHSEERDKVVDFSPPHTIVYHAVFARQDTPAIESEEELRGKEIIVMRGDIMHDYVLENGLRDSAVSGYLVIVLNVTSLEQLIKAVEDWATAEGGEA